MVESDQIRVKRKSLQLVLEQCMQALASLEHSDQNPSSAAGDGDEEEEREDEGTVTSRSETPCADYETDELCDLLKSKVESPNFLEKLGSIHMPVSQNIDTDETSWDMVTAKDIWEDKSVEGETESDPDSYVLVSQNDITEGIGCFVAAYLLSLKQTKDLNPSQLQEALIKTFSVRKKKSKLRKAWDGSKIVYNVASWSATAIGIYQNPAILRVASAAFWTSCRVVSKLL